MEWVITVKHPRLGAESLPFDESQGGRTTRRRESRGEYWWPGRPGRRCLGEWWSFGSTHAGLFSKKGEEEEGQGRMKVMLLWGESGMKVGWGNFELGDSPLVLRLSQVFTCFNGHSNLHLDIPGAARPRSASAHRGPQGAGAQTSGNAAAEMCRSRWSGHWVQMAGDICEKDPCNPLTHIFNWGLK